VQVRPRVIGIAKGQGPKRILVVDDSLENRLLLKALLEGVGFLVSEAANGREALRVEPPRVCRRLLCLSQAAMAAGSVCR
jgi:DNA-binding NtrC family response regulator